MQTLLFLLLAVIPVAASAAEPAAGTLTSEGQVVRWEGARFVDANLPAPEACALGGCDAFDVTVNVPADFWNTLPGGLEISIQWEDESQDIDLYVYGPDDGARLAAVSKGFGSRAESVRIAAAGSGKYHAVIVPASTTDTAYRGLAEFETTFPTTQGDLLPNLRALPPKNFNFAIGAYTLTPFDSRDVFGEEDGPSCYPEEIVEQGAQRCLRFDGGAENVGDGRFELRIDVSTLASGEREVEQAIYRSDGERRFRPAGQYTAHPTHGHVHYRDFARYEIHPVSGGQAIRSRKADFCMIDVENRRFEGPETQGNDKRRGAFPDCNLPSEFDDAGGAFMVQGISRGWADVYAWPLPGQYVEVTGLPDGLYDVVVYVNPNGSILESDYGDNVACTRIEVTGSTASEAETQPTTCPASATEPPADPGPIDLPLPH